MVAKKESNVRLIKEGKVMRKFQNLPEERRAKYLDVITGIKMLEDMIKEQKELLVKNGLPSFEEIQLFHKNYGWEYQKETSVN